MLPNNSKILIYHKAIDMRKGINGLSIFIADELSLDPGDGSIYIFYNRSYKKLKLIYWDRNGFCLFYKILEKERFILPEMISLRSITHEQLRWLFDGFDIEKVRGFKDVKYSNYF